MGERPRDVGVLGGTGPQGRGLGLRLALAGHRVTLGSRSPRRALDTAHALSDTHGVAEDLLRGGANPEAAASDVVIVAVPFDGLRSLLEPIAGLMAGTVVISCVNRLRFDDRGPSPVPVEEGSAAELIAGLLPRSQVFGAFHHVPAGRLTRDTGPLDMDVLVTGDDGPHPDVREVVQAIGGVRAVYAGPLRLTRPLEELTAVVLAVNGHYKVAAGIRMAGLPDDRAAATAPQ